MATSFGSGGGFGINGGGSGGGSNIFGGSGRARFSQGFTNTNNDTGSQQPCTYYLVNSYEQYVGFDGIKIKYTYTLMCFRTSRTRNQFL